MAKVGFWSLVFMGKPTAKHLVDAGHSVTVWSHNSEKTNRFAKKHGCALGRTPANVAQKSQISFLCMGDTPMPREAILGEAGLTQEDIASCNVRTAKNGKA